MVWVRKMKAELIRKSILFAGMSEEERLAAYVSMDVKERGYSKGEAIFCVGIKTHRMGMVLSGSVTIESNDMWGNRTILSHVGAGQFFAETYAWAEAWHIKLLTNLLTVAARKNLILSGRSFHTAPKTIRGRVLAYLNSVSLQKKNTEFDIPFDRQQLADYLNLERTALSKELGKMQREGLIECRKNHFRLIETGKKVGK